jgi:chemotaxis protein histidine kinase CheA
MRRTPNRPSGRPPAAAENGPAPAGAADASVSEKAVVETVSKQNFISVNVNKLEQPAHIVGEIVTAQSMVINSADFGAEQHDSI